MLSASSAPHSATPPEATSDAYASFAALGPETAPLWPEGAAAASGYGQLSFGLQQQKRRRSWNAPALLISVFMPWLIFVAVFAVMSFHFRSSLSESTYVDSTRLTVAICGVCLFTAIGFGLAAGVAWRRPLTARAREPTWFTVLFFSTLIAWAAGMGFGDLNYKRSMQPWYQLTLSGAYTNVDPNRVGGASVADAGRVRFQANSAVNTNMAMAYMDYTDAHTFCIAPVVSNQRVANATYDFWSVGHNCCPMRAGDGGDRARWVCDVDLKMVPDVSGLRYTGDERQFRMALRQAEAKYNITVANPIFFRRKANLDTTVEGLRDRAMQDYITGIFVYVVAQGVFVMCAMAVLTWLGW